MPELSMEKFVLITLLIAGYITSFTCAKEFTTLDHLRSSTSADDQAQSVRDLIQRKLGSRASEFNVTVDPGIGPRDKDTFVLKSIDGNRISVTGSSGVAAAWGFYYYLSQYCGCHISWAGDQLNLPTTLPALPSGGVKIISNDRFRYYMNVCTVSYSFLWWNWTRWETEIDWMAMNGINLPLAFTAQEAIWQRVLLKMGFTPLELDNHFAGAAFLSWSRMGNMHGWGGPLPQSWHTQQVALQHKILDRMRALGMIPVLPAFSGFVPKAMKRIFPSAKVTAMGNWCSFEDVYCCDLLLDVEDPLFAKFGKAFLQEYITEFGTDHVYNADTFNEMSPPSGDPAYLRRAGQAVFNSMTVADPDAIWLMQGWLFMSDFWDSPRAKALLTSVPQGKMIVLDLFAESFSQYNRFESFFGQPFIWCMLQNFGGTISMFGTIEALNQGPPAARNFTNSSLIGIGLTMEGINQNNVVYEFMLENSWRDKPRNITQWFENYSYRRYGAISSSAQMAWKIFQAGVYNCTQRYSNNGLEVFTVRPRLNNPINPAIWYDVDEFFQGWNYMVDAASTLIINNPLFRYDLVDTTRQAMQLVGIFMYQKTLQFYKTKDYRQFKKYSSDLLGLFDDLESVLCSNEHFLLGNWVESAKDLATSEWEKRLYEYNARNQITLWGPRGEILDYANKQWAGVVKTYYAPRWKLFLDELDRHFNTTFDEGLFNNKVFVLVEQPFTFDRTVFPTTPTGDSVAVATRINQQYRPLIRKHSKFFRSLREISEHQRQFEQTTLANFRLKSSASGNSASTWIYQRSGNSKHSTVNGKNRSAGRQLL